MAEPNLIRKCRRILGMRGPTTDSKILDFCCGAGSTVRSLREAGYDVVGFEPFTGVAPNDAEFATWHWPNPHVAGGDIEWKQNWREHRLPYPDQYFDLVFSEQVMEHVSDHEGIMGELARVTKPDGAQIHFFPGCWKLIEPHVNVPLGGIFKNYLWYLLWQLLGWHNGYLRDWPKRERAAHMLKYARGSLNYRSPRFFKRLGKKHFRTSRFVPKSQSWFARRTRDVTWVLARPRSQ